MHAVPNGHYETRILFARRDRSPSATSLDAQVEQALQELGYNPAYNLGHQVYITVVEDRGALLISLHPGEYVGGPVNPATEGMALTAGLEETLKRKTIALFEQKFTNVVVTPLSLPV